MDLKQIRSFVEIANSQSYSKAARVLNITQPALSRQIQTLESELRTQLLFRTTRGVMPTEAGVTLLRMAATLINHVEHMREEVTRAAQSPTGAVTIGMPASISPMLAPALLQECAQTLPDVTVRVIEGMSVFLEEWLNVGKLDIAVLTDPGPAPALECRHLMRETMVVVGRHDCFSAGRRTIRLAELALLPLIMTRGFYALLQLGAARKKVAMNCAMEVESVALIKQLIAKKSACSVLPYTVVHEEVQAGELMALEIADACIKRDLIIATSAKRPVAAAARALGELVAGQVRRIVVHPLEAPLAPQAASGRRAMQGHAGTT